MSALTNYQIIEQNGKPAFVVIPYDEFMASQGDVLEDGLVPNDLVRRNLLDGVPLLKCWREHLGITQDELEQKSGVAQPVIARIETGATANPRKSTLKKLAAAMNLTFEQIQE